MAQRINITIPDDLFEKLQAVKDKLNISRICQEAITMEVAIQESKEKGGKEAIISRLKAQKKQGATIYEQQGRKAGLEDSEQMDYEDLVAVSKNGDAVVKELEDRGCVTRPFGDLPIWEVYIEPAFDAGKNDDPAFDEVAYFRGWVKGVTEFFDDIKRQL